MPVPTPPNKELFKVTPPKPKMRADSIKLDDQIKQMTADLAKSLDIPTKVITEARLTSVSLVKDVDPKNGVFPIQVVKKKPFVPTEHLTQNPFRENDALKKLQYDLKKETDPKKPVKRTPRRKPATKTTGEK